MLRIGIVEDDHAYAETISNFIKRYCTAHDLDVEITTFPNGLEIVEGYHPIWDILFMDIEMPHMDGMEASRRIRERDSSVILIFITTMAQYAIKGYEVNAMDFVLKPINYSQLSIRLDKAVRILEQSREKYVLLPIEDGKEKIAVSEILFIETQGHNLNIITRNRAYRIRRTLTEMERSLQGCHFSRCNQCYLVNLRNVDKMKKDSVIVGGHELEMSRPRKKPFMEDFSDYLGDET